jgi:hypothetical protein
MMKTFPSSTLMLLIANTVEDHTIVISNIFTVLTSEGELLQLRMGGHEAMRALEVVVCDEER